MHSLEATVDDVATALGRLGLDGYEDDLAERWHDRLDLDEAMSAADDASDDMDDQTEALVSNLETQLRALGVPDKTLEAIEAEEEAAELGETLEAPVPSPPRPRI